MEPASSPGSQYTPRGTPPRGPAWNAQLRYEWFVILHNTWWDRNEDPEWITFAADWAREVYLEGRDLG
jgi:hypothetical protein